MEVIFLKTRLVWPDDGGQSYPVTEVDGPYEIPARFFDEEIKTVEEHMCGNLHHIWLFNNGFRCRFVEKLTKFTEKDATKGSAKFLNALREWEKLSPFHPYANPFTGRIRDNESDVVAVYVPQPFQKDAKS